MAASCFLLGLNGYKIQGMFAMESDSCQPERVKAAESICEPGFKFWWKSSGFEPFPFCVFLLRVLQGRGFLLRAVTDILTLSCRSDRRRSGCSTWVKHGCKLHQLWPQSSKALKRAFLLRIAPGLEERAGQ